MSVHYLKTTDVWWNRVAAGEKTAEIRKHDRDFQVGDELRLVKVHDRIGSGWTAEELTKREANPVPFLSVVVTHVLPSSQFDGLVVGFSLLSFKPVDA